MEQMILTILEGGEAGQDLQGLIHSDCCARDPWKNGKYKLKQRPVEALLNNKISPTATKTHNLYDCYRSFLSTTTFDSQYDSHLHATIQLHLLLIILES